MGRAPVEMVVQALPKMVTIMTVCSGSGMVELSAQTLAAELNKEFGTELEASVRTSRFVLPSRQVSHGFMCEIVPNKQVFLKKHVLPAEDCLLRR